MDKDNREAVAKWIEVFNPSDSIVCTKAFSDFLADYRLNFDFFMFTVQLTSNADRVRLMAAQTLLDVGPVSEEKRKELEDSIAEGPVVQEQLKKHALVQSQNLTNGAVNAFQRYFSSIVQLAAKKRPTIMSSSQTIRLDDVFRFTTHKELAAFIIDRKVNDLSYGGLGDMEKYFDERLGVQMFENDDQRALLRLFVEVRNINVHNGGVVNDVFANRVGHVKNYPYTKGKRFLVDLDRLIALSDNAMCVAKGIDAAIGAKFRLQRKKHRAWRKQR